VWNSQKPNNLKNYRNLYINRKYDPSTGFYNEKQKLIRAITRTKVFWDVTLRHWVGGFNILKSTWYLHIKQQSSPREMAIVGCFSWTALPSKV
jgi:hypothetical protein